MNSQQKEINQAWHLYALPIHKIAEKHNITQEQVCNFIVSWERFFKELTK